MIPFLLWLKNENNSLEYEQSFCTIKLFTGLPCPTCGMTKSIVYFYDGNFKKSLDYHLFGPFLVIFCIFFIIKNIFYKKATSTYLSYRNINVLIIIFVIYYFFR
jgi:hypothetical protein